MGGGFSWLGINTGEFRKLEDPVMRCRRDFHDIVQYIKEFES
jgi:hypothetical protein